MASFNDSSLTFTSELLVINDSLESKECLALTHTLCDAVLHSRLHLIQHHHGVHGSSTLRNLLGWFGQWLCLGLQNNLAYYILFLVREVPRK